MRKAKQRKLQATGWQVGTAAEFLNLTPEEASLVEIRIALSHALRDWRARRELTQVELARRLRSSQSRVAKMEAADPTVSIDLLLRSLFHLGATPRDIARVITRP